MIKKLLKMTIYKCINQLLINMTEKKFLRMNYVSIITLLKHVKKLIMKTMNMTELNRNLCIFHLHTGNSNVLTERMIAKK